MFEGLVGGLVIAWLLSCFNVDSMVLEVLQPHISVVLTQSHYYIGFAILGLIGGLLGKN